MEVKDKSLALLALLSYILGICLFVHFYSPFRYPISQELTPVYSAFNVLPFGERDVAICIDDLRSRLKKGRSADKRNGNRTTVMLELTKRRDPLHIAFAGDSRVRQHFLRFVQALPQHDLEMSGDWNYKHGSRQTKSKMLNLVVAFWWRPNIIGEIGSKLMKDVHLWISTPPDHKSNKPDILVLGASVHDMLIAENGTNVLNHKQYRNRLLELRPLLQQLGKSITRVIWLSSYPTYDMVIKNWKSSEIFSEKIRQYNVIARAIFRESGVHYWESWTPIARDYIRACAWHQRDTKRRSLLLGSLVPYFFCIDYLHPGNVVVSAATNAFLSYICKLP